MVVPAEFLLRIRNPMRKRSQELSSDRVRVYCANKIRRRDPAFTVRVMEQVGVMRAHKRS